MRLARNLNQCLHVDFSEKKKMHDESNISEEDEEKKGFTVGMFQERDKPKDDKEDIIPHKIQQLKYHLVIGQMENFLYEYEKLFQLNEDYTISPVINPRLILGSDIEPKKDKKLRHSWLKSDQEKVEQDPSKDEIPICLINREYETTEERVLTFTNVEIPDFVNYSIFYRQYNLEGYKVVLEKLQKRLNFMESFDYVQKKGARLMTSEEVRLLMEQEIKKTDNTSDPFVTLQDMWVALQNQSWMYVGLGVSKEQRPGRTMRRVEDHELDIENIDIGPKRSTLAVLYIFTMPSSE
jgi:hypothetical protein